jgi:threonine/homoserine/homoserine lactone efflux protein
MKNTCGIFRPTVKFVGDLSQTLAQLTGVALPRAVELLIVGLMVGGIIYLTYRAWSRLKNNENGPAESRTPHEQKTDS